MNDNEIKSILRKSKTIAMIGVSSEKKGEDRKNLKRNHTLLLKSLYVIFFQSL